MYSLAMSLYKDKQYENAFAILEDYEKNMAYIRSKVLCLSARFYVIRASMPKKLVCWNV